MAAGQADRDAHIRTRAAAVLTERLAAMLVHHEPGWRLPRSTALARRFGVSAPAIDAAMEELADRDLVRRLPDGKVYLASPADYLITLDGMPGLGTRVDPMGSAVTPASQHVSRRRVPEDIRQVLGLAVGQQVTVIRCTWSADEQAGRAVHYVPAGRDRRGFRSRSALARRGAQLPARTHPGSSGIPAGHVLPGALPATVVRGQELAARPRGSSPDCHRQLQRRAQRLAGSSDHGRAPPESVPDRG